MSIRGSAPMPLRVSLASVLLALPPIAQSQVAPWMNPALAPERRAVLLVRAMTLPEKFEQLVGSPGVVPELPQCYGARHVNGIPRLLIPTFRITNGPVGVGQNDCVPLDTPNLPRGAQGSRESARATQLPSAMAVAASFDRGVARQFGDVIGTEARDLALDVVEGPGLNLARVPQAGRNFEYFGEDPYLTGTMASAEIQAIQRHGVIAVAKHFVANEQETNRFTVNETVDDRVLHELYFLPFEMAVKDGRVASVMCSYNMVDGSYACQDEYNLTNVLRTQWGFTGYVQTDFTALHATAAAVRAGQFAFRARPRRDLGNGHRHRAPSPLCGNVRARHLRPADRAVSHRHRARRRYRAVDRRAVRRLAQERWTLFAARSTARALDCADRSSRIRLEGGGGVLRRQLRRDSAVLGCAARRHAAYTRAAWLARGDDAHHRRERQRESHLGRGGGARRGDRRGAGRHDRRRRARSPEHHALERTGLAHCRGGGGESAHDRRAEGQCVDGHALDRSRAGRARGVVSGRRRRQHRRGSVVRRGDAVGPVAGHVPAARG